MTTDICLITPGHVASTPRLVKSADALSEAGYSVHVVAGAPFPPADPLDADILSNAKWAYTRVDTRTGPGVFAGKALRKLSRLLIQHSGIISPGLAARAHHAASPSLVRAAARVPARLYIGHSLPGLYVAAMAAEIRGSSYGFDIEDYHDAETEEAMADPVERRSRFLLQSRLLHACRTLTCAAPLIGTKYREVYHVEPTTVLNVFPLSQAPANPMPPKAISEENPATFYWFSQTVGKGRGLEEFIRVLGRMRTPSELHLRGFVSPRYAAGLQEAARAAGVRRPITFLEPGSPNEMARLAAHADIGLSLEPGEPFNKSVCLANKDFVYLLAGIPQLLSSTAAQIALAAELGDAGILADMGRPVETASRLDALFSDPARVAAARASAWRLGRERYNWDNEKEILVRLVNAALPLNR
jgi:glycosyltransferase involved in cell wall biosynthesis